ncbi:hypothetical protein ALI22I_00255 [Saccharothrix sp. ALI-22-I]|uniref:ATP-binding protein n=1 Tax=Saccharothrix sp. ALI-22-I TaxID=1933778 RepID=UPI00097BF4EB|nr:ATP-binding protein [Saccharothrix sp. ALI-22-I]ONI93076.1 hypothetical protein ALI22I_00255 [Saccharothrix sp. ALI-22-I]
MTHRLPTLVDLPVEVPETAVWPELSARLGSVGQGIGPRERRWLTIATLHRSALYEDAELSAVVSRECLSLLEGVGKSVLELELRMVIGQRDLWLDVAQRNVEQARLIGPARLALVKLLGVENNARLGVGEWQQLTSGHATRSIEIVMLQLLGWWSLMLPGGAIRNSVQLVHTDLVTDMSVGSDWRTTFDQHFGRLSPQFSYARQGPDHAAVFQATVTTQDGRSGTGSAARKKDAAQLACRAYLTAHAPRLPSRQGAANPVPPLTDIPVHIEYKRLAALFGAADARLFSKALVHKSWVYENTVHKDRRASNEVLANLGSAVLGVIAARTRAAYLLSRSTRPEPDLSTGLTVPDADLVPLGYALGLPAACNLGVGQKRVGMSAEMLANFVQAVLAAGYVQAPDVDVFENRLPAVVVDFLVAHGGRSTRDAATRLQELAVELDLEWPWTDRRTGPDHARTYHNTIRISDGSMTVVVEGAGATRTAAKKAAAAEAIEGANLRFTTTDAVKRSDLARFFIVRQLEMLSAKPNRWPQWWQRNVLCANHVANRDWAAFARWTDAVHRTGLLDIAIPVATQEALADYYQQAARSAGARPHFAAGLSRVLRWIDSAMEDDRVVLESEPWEELVALTAAHGIWLISDGTTDLAHVLERWARPERRRAAVVVNVEGPAETGAQAGAAVQRILQELRPLAPGPDSNLRAVLVPGGPAHEIRLSPLGRSVVSAPIVTLVCEAAPEVVVEQHDGEIILRVAGQGPAESSWLWDAAIRSRVTDEYDVELARLLHDLKNQVTGARLALSRPTATRTEQREADLDASRHIDSAAAIAAQLVDAELLYNAAEAGTCELGSFLRGYSSDLINRLPPGIRVVPPVTTLAPVAVSAEVLRGALDNLVKNAVEAMGDDGQIEFEYTLVEGDGVVLLEVRDTGPGLPDDVISALRADGPAPSSKRHGSGLGLPGVMRMMRRAGSDMHPLRTASGGAWLIRLTLAEENGAVDG